MPKNIRALETNGLYINRWITGDVTNRSPLYAPVSAMGLQMLNRLDAMYGGQNVEISPQYTPVRSYGFSRYCSAAFGSSDWPLGFYSFKNLSGTLKTFVDCPTKTVSFTTSAQTTVFSKSSTAQGSFAKVGDYVYYVDGTDADARKWNASLTVSGIGIAAPSVAPGLSFGAGSLSPKISYRYVYAYRSSATGHVSTASPASASTAAQTSKNITVSYTASTDAQVDKIWIFRTDDGGSQYYFLAEVANGTSTYTDSTADTGLNDDISAPLAHANDPLPSGTSLLVWHAGRLWAASGNTLSFSAGPDCLLGNGAEAWPPANKFPCPGKIKALASTTSGLLIFLDDNSYVVFGLDASTFTVPQVWQQNFGVPNQNHVAQDGDLLFIYTSTSQAWMLTSSGLSHAGESIADKLRSDFPAGSCYLALHRNGEDQGFWLSNGSNKMRRYSISLGSWDVTRAVVGGAGAIGSVEASSANWKLFTGRTAGSGFILARDITTCQDDSVSFPANFTVGAITVAPPGQTSAIESVLVQAKAVGTYPKVSILANEISGPFIELLNPKRDPQWSTSTTVLQKRHYIKGAVSPIPELMNHLQIQVDFGTENFRNEILGLGLGEKP